VQLAEGHDAKALLVCLVWQHCNAIMHESFVHSFPVE